MWDVHMAKETFELSHKWLKKKKRKEKLGWAKAKSPEWKKRGVAWLELSEASDEVEKDGAELGWGLTEEPHSPAQDLVPFPCLRSYCGVWSRETKWWATCFRKPGSFFYNILAMPGLHSVLPFSASICGNLPGGSTLLNSMVPLQLNWRDGHRGTEITPSKQRTRSILPPLRLGVVNRMIPARNSHYKIHTSCKTKLPQPYYSIEVTIWVYLPHWTGASLSRGMVKRWQNHSPNITSSQLYDPWMNPLKDFNLNPLFFQMGITMPISGGLL